ncbi:MAG TPA: PTS sugar transporter subunit IIC [Lachnoclostridium sp.]|jgi:PTS system cellobiose-specific IIC component|uniref:PTS sugar transporter subunit IIC n=1 Tax=Lacrimispora sp. TaxID=2719234 RepID=UPI000EC09A88|nr:PTS transporter subunit EIIC [Lacrimispora sp.]HCD45024.1 PTS sugar transporter subunit IIC [Lachnoclostridium sp.]
MEAQAKKTVLERSTDFIEQKIAPPLLSLSQVRYLEALQRTFITLMPYMVLGATITLILNLSGLFAEETGLNMLGVAKAIDSVTAPCRPWLLQIVFVTINLLAMVAALLNGYFLGDYYNRKDSNVTAVASAVVAMIAFLCFIDFSQLSAEFDWPVYILGSPSLFGGLLISIFAVEIYRFLIGRKITIKMPEAVPPMIASAFTSMIPVCAVIILCTFIGQGIGEFDFLSMLNQGTAYLVVGGSGPVAQGIGFMLDRLLWFVGLHGSNIVSSVMQPIWATMITDNINAFAAHQKIPYMFTEQWINFYVRCSLFPVALLCTMSKVKRFKVLGKLSLPGTIFNIAEPVMYGLPIVLNPLMFVPWVLGFAVLYIFNAILGILGITPPVVAMTVWTMPAPLASFIGSGFNIVAPIITLMNFVIIFFMFLPFFKVMEKQALIEEQQYEMELERKK